MPVNIFKPKRIIIIIIAWILLIFISYGFVNACLENTTSISYSVKAGNPDEFQFFFYTHNEEQPFAEEKSFSDAYVKVGKFQKIKHNINPKDLSHIRFDAGTGKNNSVIYKDIVITSGFTKTYITADFIIQNFELSLIDHVSSANNELIVHINGDDPYFSYRELSYSFGSTSIIGALILGTIALIVLLMLFLFAPIRNFIKTIIHSRKLIFNLSYNDFKKKYAGSYFGIFWAFVNPLITVLVYVFVFQLGFRAGAVGNFPFALWLCIGMVPWFFFSDALMNASSCLNEYSYLVKKVVFNINILPVVKVISSCFVHLVFVVLVLIFYFISGFKPDIYLIQIIYYSMCTFMLAAFLSFLFSAILVFFKDMAQVIGIILQIGIWMTPIMWDISIIPPNLQWIIRLNPMYYIVSGYRDTFINKVWFWEHPLQLVYFGAILSIIALLGTGIFRKLRPHFADVL